MSEAFDIGPLHWVHDEIKLALNQAISQITVYEGSNENFSALKHALTHLNQVSGALDIVGLEGCKFFCFEIETLISAIEKQVLVCDLNLIHQLKSAIHQLGHYLQSLLNGESDQPLRLYETLATLFALRGESLEPSALFFPCIDYLAPNSAKTSQILLSENPQDFYNTQRNIFQRALLAWLKAPSNDYLLEMRNTLTRIHECQGHAVQRTFWWVASAFFDALAKDEFTHQTQVKKIMRRIDQQLCALVSNTKRLDQLLMRDLLYVIAIAETHTPLLQEVNTRFELQRLIPKKQSLNQKHTSTPFIFSGEKAESEAVQTMLYELATIKTNWHDVSVLEGGAFAKFVSQTQWLLMHAKDLNHQATVSVVIALNVFAQVWDESGLNPTEDALVEVAAGLALLEKALEHYESINQDLKQHLLTQAERIKNIAESVVGDAAQFTHDHQELAEDALIALASQIQEALNASEQALDFFFRNQQNIESLAQLDEPLKQMLAAFDMLNMQVPMNVVRASQHLIDMFKHQAATSSQLECLADSLSLLGSIVNDLPRTNISKLNKLEVLLVTLTGVSSPELQVLAQTIKLEESGVEYEIASSVVVDTEMRGVFLQEAEEVLASIAENIKTLRLNHTEHAALVNVRRGFHTIKGSGRMVGLHALGEMAWMAEALFNELIDHHLTPNVPHINFAEEVSIVIADGLVSIEADTLFGVDLEKWQAKLAALQVDLIDQSVVFDKEDVLIGGTHKISKALFDVFVAEALEHLHALKSAQAMLEKNQGITSLDIARRAVHTLASNAGAAGFVAIESLSRSMEDWLALDGIIKTKDAVDTFSDCVNALDKMLQEARRLQQPKQARRLLNLLKEALLVSQQSTSVRHQESGYTAIAEAQVSMITQDGLVSELKDTGLLVTFAEEAADLLSRAATSLRNWQQNTNTLGYAEELQRDLHTLKGIALMVGFADLADAVHVMEDRVLAAIHGDANHIHFDVLFDHLDVIASQIESNSSGQGIYQAVNTEADGTTSALDGVEHEVNVQQLRLKAEVLDRLINEAGEISIARSRIEQEMLDFKQHSLDLTESLNRLKAQLREMEIEAESTLQSRLAHLQEMHESFDPLEFDRFTRLQELTRLMAESVNDINTIQHSLTHHLDETDAALSQQSRMNRELQFALMNIRIVPFASISERLHRIVRQTARVLGKNVELKIDGEFVDIDRSVLDHIGGALEHLLRNAVAHGVEFAEERNKLSKPVAGNITIKVRRENDEMNILISDDGAGFDLDRIRNKAKEQGRLSLDETMTEEALLGIIFEPGFSTASTVSQIAGRGVGLDSVRSDVSALGGRIDVTNNEGAGATFSIHLPVNLSLAQVVLVRSGSLVFALPAVIVDQVQKIKLSAFTDAQEAGSLHWNDTVYPLHYLGKLVGENPIPESKIYTPVILLRSGKNALALHVDEVIANQEVVMKPAGHQLAHVSGIVGTSVLGDGQIIYMLNPIQIAHRDALTSGSIKMTNIKKLQDLRKLVLVVDDSLTMRKVLSRLLEREGYRVATAIHGVDALQVLQEINPDIILTDIEMPSMDGFELVRQLRNEAVTAKTPIMMISSRTADKHQALAKKIGVNLFMGKPIHDEALLAHISSLLN